MGFFSCDSALEDDLVAAGAFRGFHRHLNNFAGKALLPKILVGHDVLNKANRLVVIRKVGNDDAVARRNDFLALHRAKIFYVGIAPDLPLPNLQRFFAVQPGVLWVKLNVELQKRRYVVFGQLSELHKDC